MTALLEARNLLKHFPVRRGLVLPKEIGRVRAVDCGLVVVAAGPVTGFGTIRIVRL